jgi:hypothetical protein
MKRNFLLPLWCLIALVWAGNANAQETKKDSILTLMAKDVCAELKGKNITGANAQMEIGTAMMPIFVKYMDDLKDFYDMDSMDAGMMQKMGTDVGMKLVAICPDFLKAVASNPAAFGGGAPAGAKPVTIGAMPVKQQQVTGTLVRITPGDFTFVEVKDAAGKSYKLWWFEFFEGADKLTVQNLSKKFTFSYTEKELYNPRLKEYVSTRIITGVQP